MYGVATCQDDINSALRLVYDIYVKEGFIFPDDKCMYITLHHSLPTSKILIAKDKDKVLCTMSLICDGNIGLPADDIYHKELDALRLTGARVTEVSCFVSRESCPLKHVIGVMGATAQCAGKCNISHLIIAVHPHHVLFYKKFLAFQQYGPEKLYKKVNNNPAILMVMNLGTLQEDNPTVYRRLFNEKCLL